MEAEDGKPSSMELFPFKLFRMLNEATAEGFDSIVSWMPITSSSSTSSSKSDDGNVDDGDESNDGCDDGRNDIIHVFRVHKVKEFEEFVMPIYFRRSHKYSYRTFTRSLNLWCFERIKKGPFKNAYYHPLFEKDQPSSCSRIVRIKNKSNPKQANCSNHSASLDIVSEEEDVFSEKSPENTSTISSFLLMQTQGASNTTSGSMDRCLSGGDLMRSFDPWEPDLMGSFDYEPVPIMTKTNEPSEPPPRAVPSITSFTGVVVDQDAKEKGKGIDMLLFADAFNPRPIHPASLAALAAASAAATTNVGMNHTTVGSSQTNLLGEETIFPEGNELNVLGSGSN